MQSVADDSLTLFRVQASKKGSVVSAQSFIIPLIQSEWSEILHLPAPEPIASPAQLPPPVLEALSHRSVVAKWKEYKAQHLPSSASILYELRKMGTPSQSLYSGPRLDYRFDGLKPLQTVELQVVPFSRLKIGE